MLVVAVVVFPSHASFRSYEVLEATRFSKIFSRCLDLTKNKNYLHKKRGFSKPVDISSKSICLTCMEGEMERAAVKQLTAAAC